MTRPASTWCRRGWRVGGVSIVASLLLLLAATADASAALWVRIALAPASPTVGEATRVSVLTFYFNQRTATGQVPCANDPLATPIPYVVQGQTLGNFELEASTDSLAEPIVVLLSRRATDPTWWDGSLTFPRPGRWTLRLVYPGSPEPYTECAGFKAAVTVLPARLPTTGAGGGAGDAAAIVGAVLVIAGASLVVAAGGRVRSIVRDEHAARSAVD